MGKKGKKIKKNRFYVFMSLVLIMFLSLTISGAKFISFKVKESKEHWPQLKDKSAYKAQVQDALTRFPTEARDYTKFLEDYDTFGDYLNYGKEKKLIFNNDRISFDFKDNMPRVKYDGKYELNPVTLAQYSLALYGEYKAGKDTKDEFLKCVDTLLTLQDDKGAFRYKFPWRYYLNKEAYNPGWVSGMAQGQALSVLSRAYKITKDKKYLKAGNKCFQFMISPIEQGGTMTDLRFLDPSLKDYIIFEEYITDPPSYTLNGYMFALLGVYDWGKVKPLELRGTHKEARKYFKQGIRTLEKILPYYDLGGFTAYDLNYMVRKDIEKPHIGVNYHGVHIYLLKALYSVTENEVLLKYYNLWKSYV